MNYSTSAAGSIATVAGFIALLANHYGLSFVTTADLTAVLGSLLVIGGIVTSWVGQVKNGSQTVSGFKVLSPANKEVVIVSPVQG
jgi:hypothetical protein